MNTTSLYKLCGKAVHVTAISYVYVSLLECDSKKMHDKCLYLIVRNHGKYDVYVSSLKR